MAIGIAPPEPDPADARKRRRDMRALWRLCGWGGSTAIALAAVAIATQTDNGSTRLQFAFASENQPGRAVTVAVEKDAETRALEAQLRTLAADRDRLATRIASLERNLDDMTGSIKRQAARAEAAPVARSAAPTAIAASTPPQLDSAIPPPSPPDMSAPVISPLAMLAITGSNASWPGTPQTQAAPTEPAAIPLPPTRVATAPSASETAAEPSPTPEFGVDLGSAPNVEALRVRWAAVKANFGPLLTGLHPLATHDRRPGAVPYRLVIGPLPSVADAAKLCARFTAARTACHTAKFDGQKLAQQ